MDNSDEYNWDNERGNIHNCAVWFYPKLFEVDILESEIKEVS